MSAASLGDIMKFSTLVSGLVAAAVSLCAVSPSLAASDPKYILPEAARAAPDGRSLVVLVGQEELKSNINPSTVVVATGGGLIGALIDAKINADRAARALDDMGTDLRAL